MTIARASLCINLSTIVSNWLHLKSLGAEADCGAVVKANAYGLGVERVSSALFQAGCRSFYVATLAEGLELKQALPSDVDIYILSGLFPGDERPCAEAGLIPVLVSSHMLQRWVAETQGIANRSAVKVDTGMGRLGLSESEFAEALNSGQFESAGVGVVMSHLACADEPAHELNSNQLQRFSAIRQQVLGHYPQMRFSLANSSGIVLGSNYHFDLTRPGVALFGEGAAASIDMHLKPVVSLRLPILMVRRLHAGETAGYGATYVAPAERDIACVAGGYADGLFRLLSNNGRLFLNGEPVPIVGRVSMDSVLVDVSGKDLYGLATEDLPGLELLGAHQSANDLAGQAQTVAYEILTSLGDRFSREYLESSGLDGV